MVTAGSDRITCSTAISTGSKLALFLSPALTAGACLTGGEFPLQPERSSCQGEAEG